MAVTIPIGLMNEKSDKLHVKLGEGKRSMKLVYRGARLHHHRVEVAGRHVPKHPDAAGGVDGCAKVVLWTHVRGVLACSERASLPMLPPVASVPSPPSHKPAPQHLGDEMAHGRTGGWLLAAETISAGQTTRPPEIILIDITSEEIRGHTSLGTALVYLVNVLISIIHLLIRSLTFNDYLHLL